MKVITLKQPWATLVAEGIKKYEFRSWKTKYRGKLLIHAGVGVEKQAMSKFKNLNFEYPSGKIIAVVDLEECLELNDELNNKIISEKNIIYGDKKRSGYAWKLNNVKKINCDENIKGQLGLWNLDTNMLNIKKKLKIPATFC
jgi:hypothetical protein